MLRPLILLLLIASLSLIFIYSQHVTPQAFVDWANSAHSNPNKIPIYIVVCIIVCFTSLPVGVIAKVLSGWLFGFNSGFFISYFSILLGSWMAFTLARYLGQDFINLHWKRQSDKVNYLIASGTLLPLVQLRIFPFIPLPITNYTLGITSTSHFLFLLSSAIGMLPATLFYSYVGASLDELTVDSFNFIYFIPYYIYISLALFATLCLQLLRKKKYSLPLNGDRLLLKTNQKDLSRMQEILPFLESRRSSLQDHDWDEQAIPSYLHPVAIVKYVFWKRIRVSAQIVTEGDTALDYGCGAGAMFPWLHEKFKHIYAFDVDPKSRKSAAEISKIKNWNNIEIIEDSGLSKIKTESLDTIVALDVLEHVDELPQLLVEFNRILKPNGVLVVSSPTENFFYRLTRVFAGPGYQGEFHLRAAKDVETDLAKIFKVKLVKRIFPVFTFFRIVTATKIAN